MRKRAFFVFLVFPVLIFLGLLGWTLMCVSEPKPTKKTSVCRFEAGVAVLSDEFQFENVAQSS